MPTDKAFRWYGGKGQIARKILPLMPAHTVYVEAFAGSAAIMMAKRQAQIEVLNDVNSHLVNFYRVIRDPAMCNELTRLADLTPYSREEFERFTAIIDEGGFPVLALDELHAPLGAEHLEWAHAFLVTTAQAFTVGDDTPCWGVRTNRDWLASCSKLAGICRRLQNVIIENADWSRVVEDYNQPNALIYMDPPYVMETRNFTGKKYRNELGYVDHITMIRRIMNAKAMVMISGMADAAYKPLEEAGWTRHEFAVKTIMNTARVDVLWANPLAELNRAGEQGAFDFDGTMGQFNIATEPQRIALDG